MESQSSSTASSSIEADQSQHKTFFWVFSIGTILGYEFGVTGSLLSLPPFLELFFPHEYKKSHSGEALFGGFVVNLYISSMYLAAFISACTITIFRINSNKKMRIGAWLMTIGALIYASGLNFWVITCGRILLGFGIGIVISNVILLVPSQVSEVAPFGYRRKAMMILPLTISFGILDANLGFYVLRIPMIWNYLGFTGLVCIALWCICSSHFMTVTWHDHSLLFDYTWKDEIFEAGIYPINQVQISPSGSIIFDKKYIPPLVMVICIPIFQQLTGAYAFMIYAPFLFKTIGLSDSGGSYLCCTVMFFVNWLVTRVLAATIDKFERRSLFVQGGLAMQICQMIITFIIRAQEDLSAMPKWKAILLAVAMCVYVAGFAWSWGPLGWLVPGEILPAEIQPIGYSLCVSINMMSMFFVTLFFMMGLCKMRLSMHLVISSLVLFMTIFVYLFLPESKGVEVDDVSEIWKTHWFWKIFTNEEDKIDVLSETL